MWVRTLKAVASIGPAGTLKDIDQPSAKALMVLGFVEAVQRAEPEQEEKPKRTYQRKTVTEDKPKRTYKRKDMVAEVEPTVVVAADPEPDPEPDIVTDSGE